MTSNKRIYLLKQVFDIMKSDGEIHKNEKKFLMDIAHSLNVNTEELLDILELDMIISPRKPHLSHEEKIIQIYQLALMIKSDGAILDEEILLIKNIGLEMGLSPNSLDIMLQELFKSLDKILDFQELFSIFKINNN